MFKPTPFSSSPSIKKNTYFFPSLSRNQISSEEDSYSEEKCIHPFKSTSSKLVAWPSLHLHRKASNMSTLTQKISDVFDRTQIIDAVSRATNKQERLKVVDFVLKQRNQIQATEDRVRLERAAPLIKHFRESFKNKSKNEIPKVNKFRETLRLARTEEDDIPSSPTINYLTSLEKFDESPDGPSAHEKRVNADIENLFKNYDTDKISSSLDQKDELFKPLNLQLEKIYSNEESKKSSKSEIQLSNPNFERKGLRMDQRTSILECRRKSLTPINISKAHIVETFKGLFKKDKVRDEKEKSAFLRPKKPKPFRMTIIKSINDEAKATLEEDIYNYLLKSGDQDSYNMKSYRAGKISKVKAIEGRALSKYEGVQKEKRNSEIPEKEKSLKPFKIKSVSDKKGSYF